jgi:hypothetical protein
LLSIQRRAATRSRSCAVVMGELGLVADDGHHVGARRQASRNPATPSNRTARRSAGRRPAPAGSPTETVRPLRQQGTLDRGLVALERRRQQPSSLATRWNAWS